MPRKRKFIEMPPEVLEMHKMAAGLNPENTLNQSYFDWYSLNLVQRIEVIKSFFIKHRKLAKTDMLCLIMYDIENNKVRTRIAKYLLRKGCYRVQKSVYLANLNRKMYKDIALTLKEVQEMYDNHDSIFLIPLSVGELHDMKVIGKEVDLDLIMETRNTLFF
ncbi:MAG: CRISPR-associated endonuclease Cas2 [Hymenobacteraceae bacterium]|nr:CRISPR-associated endonuclease Cas2 [Hymenobacteraceae bacterium]MDX5443781.1 CRISPR-associated endonuclease Cas2 [Hymenobacteraceae bacterium]MDX5512892.1 CRISPR-associated endonuclease Cas2 [Hymenobacteraceae bacterium]